MKLAKILKACRVDKPEHFRLADPTMIQGILSQDPWSYFASVLAQVGRFPFGRQSESGGRFIPARAMPGSTPRSERSPMLR